MLKSLTEAAAGSTTKSRAAKKFSVIIIDSRPKLEGMKLDLCYIYRSPESKMSQVPLSFCVPSGSVSPAALRLAHYFRIALFLGPIDYIMLCKYALSQR